MMMSCTKSTGSFQDKEKKTRAYESDRQTCSLRVCIACSCLHCSSQLSFCWLQIPSACAQSPPLCTFYRTSPVYHNKSFFPLYLSLLRHTCAVQYVFRLFHEIPLNCIRAQGDQFASGHIIQTCPHVARYPATTLRELKHFKSEPSSISWCLHLEAFKVDLFHVEVGINGLGLSFETQRICRFQRQRT